MSTPSSSPVRPIVNIVSSPGPMGPEPTEDEYDDLPFKLPPGQYSHTKPDLPYAALIGQAILASPEHRLTLQEIYDYIIIVYPHFKRNEQTWVNSIRQPTLLPVRPNRRLRAVTVAQPTLSEDLDKPSTPGRPTTKSYPLPVALTLTPEKPPCGRQGSKQSKDKSKPR